MDESAYASGVPGWVRNARAGPLHSRGSLGFGSLPDSDGRAGTLMHALVGSVDLTEVAEDMCGREIGKLE